MVNGILAILVQLYNSSCLDHCNSGNFPQHRILVFQERSEISWCTWLLVGIFNVYRIHASDSITCDCYNQNFRRWQWNPGKILRSQHRPRRPHDRAQLAHWPRTVRSADADGIEKLDCGFDFSLSTNIRLFRNVNHSHTEEVDHPMVRSDPLHGRGARSRR